MSNWWENVQANFGQLSDPYGSLSPNNPSAAFNNSLMSLGTGMLANSRARPMEAFGGAWKAAQQEGQQSSMNRLNAQNLMLGMERTKKDMAWEGTERQNTLEDRGEQEENKRKAATFVEEALKQPRADIPMENYGKARFWMAAGDPIKAYEALQPGSHDYMNVPEKSMVFDKSTGKWTMPPKRADGLSGDVDFKDIMAVRKEIGDTPSVKTYSAALPIYQTMVDANKRNTKAADLNMVYGLAKIFDPNSVVREGEMVLVKDTSSLPDWLLGSIQSLNGGARLQPQTREAMLQEAQSRIQAYKASVDTDLERYRGMGGRYGINPADIMPQFPEQSPLPQQTFGPSGPYPGAHGQFNPADPLNIR